MVNYRQISQEGRRRSGRALSPAREIIRIALLCGLAFLAGCASDEAEEPSGEATSAARAATAPNPLRNAYFGDLHVHTKHSFDAYLFSVRENPDAAYRYAKGEAIGHPSGFDIQLESGPLDFQAVTDHAMYLGVMPAMDDPEHSFYDLPLAKTLRDAGAGGFARALQAMGSGELAEIDATEVKRSAWADIKRAAEEHNDPGTFTTFIGYEYTTSTAESGNLHRNVIFAGSNAPDMPFARTDSENPEDLWDWLDAQRAAGMDALAIPHNSNGSNGAMFSGKSFESRALDASYAEQRMRNEPLVEITQVKGTSETHPMLSPNDEWADFEIFPYRIATTLHSEERGSYVREALGTGLALEAEEGWNPFRFGFIGSTDTHNAGGTPEEDNYVSKVGAADGTAQLRGAVPLDEPTADGYAYNNQPDDTFIQFGASGLAGVWAEENTRASLFSAMQRKETFATSGPRIKVRFFAGYGWSEDLAADADMIEKAYDTGVTMGSDLTGAGDAAPHFIAWAMRDAQSAPLQRLQIVKVWVDSAGASQEQVFDAACADGLSVDPATHRCPDNGATVDLSDCSISQGLGAAELKTLWTDPTFDPTQRALYYVRVLENPTCRWSTWDAIRADVEPRDEVPATIQERAWSSPIWYVP